MELPAEIRRALVARAQARSARSRWKQTDKRVRIRRRIGPAGRTPSRRNLKPDVPIHIDELLETFDTLTSSEIIAALFDLELLGLVRQLPGKNFVKVW